MNKKGSVTVKPPFTSEDISNGADKRLKAEARELAEQLFFMREKLEELRKELKDAPIITEYDNGGQQRGEHINPAFKAHRDLLLTYTKTIAALESIMGKNIPEEEKNVLTMLRNRYGVSFLRSQVETEADTTCRNRA